VSPRGSATSAVAQSPSRCSTRLRLLPTFLTAFFTASADLLAFSPCNEPRNPARRPPAPGPACARGVGMLRALNADKPREFTESKGHHWGKRKLKRDQ